MDAEKFKEIIRFIVLIIIFKEFPSLLNIYIYKMNCLHNNIISQIGKEVAN